MKLKKINKKKKKEKKEKKKKRKKKYIYIYIYIYQALANQAVAKGRKSGSENAISDPHTGIQSTQMVSDPA